MTKTPSNFIKKISRGYYRTNYTTPLSHIYTGLVNIKPTLLHVYALEDEAIFEDKKLLINRHRVLMDARSNAEALYRWNSKLHFVMMRNIMKYNEIRRLKQYKMLETFLEIYNSNLPNDIMVYAIKFINVNSYKNNLYKKNAKKKSI
tara:strand:- start:442 stop:882 length:441 start_codon:yes stop_codon:yes gene_type:complete